MQVNEHPVDRVIRIILGLVIIGVGIAFKSWWGVLGLILLITGITGFCGLYTLLGINTKGKDKAPEESSQESPPTM